MLFDLQVADRRKILERIERRITQMRRDRQRDRGKADGVAVGWRFGQHFEADGAVATRAVLDHDRLAKCVPQDVRRFAPPDRSGRRRGRGRSV